MSTLWKPLLGICLALPMAAYVLGSLIDSRPGQPTPRETIVIQDAPPQPPGTADPPNSRGVDEPSGDEGLDDNGVRVVTPQPAPVGRDDDDRTVVRGREDVGDDDRDNDGDDNGDDDDDDEGPDGED
ncbi:hypothetical protein [Nocardioides sp.]|uniref:hypothetical protein n=1 Tax=Nocardioides sp. TaxID=35761 RepID=UPI003D0D7294